MSEEKEIYTADDRLIVALDVDSFDKMKALVDELGDLISYYKVGMELYYSAGSDTIRYLKEHGKKVFLDLKLHDIPNTVGHSVASVTRLGVNLITVHAAGGRAMMQAATRYAKITADELGVERPKILAVTVLTSFGADQVTELQYSGSVNDLVLQRAKTVLGLGCHGVVCSAQEASFLRRELGQDFCMVTPGIRPAGADPGDQQRIATPGQAIADGADYLVIGRPIREAADPEASIAAILKEIQTALP